MNEPWPEPEKKMSTLRARARSRSRIIFKLIFLSCFIPITLWGAIDFDQMSSDLELVRWIDSTLQCPPPYQYNVFLSTGYLTTPSARMSCPGVMALGYTWTPDYQYYNLLIQPFSHLEFSANRQLHQGIAEIRANAKLSLFTPKDSDYRWPGIAFGTENFLLGHPNTNYFAVATQVWQPLGLEFSLGWLSKRGAFAACSWSPYFQTNQPLIRSLAFTAEYDPLYAANFGLQYNYNNLFRFSLSSWQGRELALSTSLAYNWGSSRGFFTKTADPPCSPVTYQNNDTHRDICQKFKEQGFLLRKSYLCDDAIVLVVENACWIRERDVRLHLFLLLAHFPYPDVQRFIIIIESHHLACQSYDFRREWIELYCQGEMAPLEFDLLTRRGEPFPPYMAEAIPLYSDHSWSFNKRLSPRFESFFGNNRDKVKYDLGVQFEIDGCLPNSLYYEAKWGVTAFSTLNNVNDLEFYTPSDLPIVATDFIRYRNRGNATTDKLYLQTVSAFPLSFFGRAALGYFQVNYAGIAGELLWYPANACWALGLEGALLKKRTYHGLGFQSSLQKFNGLTFSSLPYNFLNQYSLDLYFDWPRISLFTKLSVGGFLARDQGMRVEATRYFQSGLRLTGWLSWTNAKDPVQSLRDFDRGIIIELPLELFRRKSCRRTLSYGLGSWLRDAGYRSYTGYPLFSIINQERRY